LPIQSGYHASSARDSAPIFGLRDGWSEIPATIDICT
jgi:hypothetical protein